VSNGAEVIMIDKNFYAEHMKDETMKRVRQEVRGGKLTYEKQYT